MKAFISYSHRDESILERIHTHLAMLKREGKLDAWYDRKILAGDRFDDEIAGELRSSDLFIPIVTPDFLASDYCFDKEMQVAIRLHEEGKLRIVSIIAEPCDWLSSPLSKFKVLPKDGRPISEWTNSNTALLDIISELRRLIEVSDRSDPPKKGVAPSQTISTLDSRSSKYLVQRDFDEIDRADFRTAAFQSISQYIEASARELDQVEGVRARFKKLDNHSFTASVVNKKRGDRAAHITVREGMERFSLGDIYYCQDPNASKGTANGALSVEADDFRLFLKETLNPFGDSTTPLTPEGAAERIWKDLLERAEISYA